MSENQANYHRNCEKAPKSNVAFIMKEITQNTQCEDFTLLIKIPGILWIKMGFNMLFRLKLIIFYYKWMVQNLLKSNKTVKYFTHEKKYFYRKARIYIHNFFTYVCPVSKQTKISLADNIGLLSPGREPTYFSFGNLWRY